MKIMGLRQIAVTPFFYRDLIPKLSSPRGNKQLADHRSEAIRELVVINALARSHMPLVKIEVSASGSSRHYQRKADNKKGPSR